MPPSVQVAMEVVVVPASQLDAHADALSKPLSELFDMYEYRMEPYMRASSYNEGLTYSSTLRSPLTSKLPLVNYSVWSK